MAALAFMIFMLIVFIIGVGFAIAGLAMVLVNRAMKKKGAGKKPLKVVGIIALVIGAIGIIIPTAYLGLIRTSNGFTDSDYIDTGTMVRWEGESFTYENEKYVPLNIRKEFEPFDFDFDAPKEQETPAFNIKQKGSFFVILFNAYDASTAYWVENSSGTTLVHTSNGIYCKESERDKAAAYYMDDENYTWSVSFFVSNDEEEKASLSLTDEEIEALQGLEAGTKYTPFDYMSEDEEEGALVMTSKDKIANANIAIVRLDDGWYWQSDEDVETGDIDDSLEKCYKLPASLSNKIDEAQK